MSVSFMVHEDELDHALGIAKTTYLQISLPEALSVIYSYFSQKEVIRAFHEGRLDGWGVQI